MNRKAMLGFLLVICSMQAARAEDQPAPAPPVSPQWSTAKKVFVGESLAAFNAGVAAASPQLFGGFLLVVTPLACIEGSGPQHQHVAADWVACGGFTTMGAYDAGIGDPDYSRSRVFIGNFIAMNLVAGASVLTQHLFGQPTAERLAEHLSIAPQLHGGVRLDYHWTF